MRVSNQKEGKHFSFRPFRLFCRLYGIILSDQNRDPCSFINTACDRQPVWTAIGQPDPFVCIRKPDMTRNVRLFLKAVKQPAQVVFSDPAAVVCYIKTDSFRLFLHGNLNGSPFFAIGEGVFETVLHHGLQDELNGMIADRCEINRQIRVDNALLRELKAVVRKLGQTAKNTIPVIAEAMEKLRANMIVFRYQLRHIGRGKQRMKEYIHAVQPKLVRYTELVQEIRGKSKERKSLLAEKKETPFYLVPKQHELSRRIAELTEELEELKSEKDMLLHSLECSDDAGIAAVKKDIPTMEATLKKLSQQEEKYTAELNDALQQYAELKSQSAEFDSDELQDARLALRPAMERSAVDRVQSAYGDRYQPLMMYDSKRDVSDMLHEEAETRSIRERLRQKQQQQPQQKQNKKKSRDTLER